MVKHVVGFAVALAAVKVASYLWHHTGLHDAFVDGVADGQRIRADADADGTWPDNVADQIRFVQQKRKEMIAKGTWSDDPATRTANIRQEVADHFDKEDARAS